VKARHEPLSEGGPEIVIDYIYAEDDKDHHDANRPLLIRNLSSASAAYGVRVLPLETDEGSVAFEPDLIPYIEALGERNVFADAKGSSLVSRRLPDFLSKSYKDTDATELFATKTFSLRIQYTGGDSMVFETECELLFRPWKKETSVGKITRQILGKSRGSSILMQEQSSGPRSTSIQAGRDVKISTGHKESGKVRRVATRTKLEVIIRRSSKPDGMCILLESHIPRPDRCAWIFSSRTFTVCRVSLSRLRVKGPMN
jgi:hypothetical protein